MDIFGILFLLFLGYRNGSRAKLKGQNGFLWGFLTVVSYIVSEGIGLFLVIMLFCRDIVDMSVFSKPNANSDAVTKQFSAQVNQALLANPLREMTVLLCGLGGYLFIRYLLERKPNKKEPEIHWMDKIGQDQ